MVWLVRSELSPALQWILPLFATSALVAVGLLAHYRKEPLASASFLAGAILSLVPAALSIFPHLHWWSAPAKVQQLFPGSFTNQQVLAACATGLGLSIFALWRLRMTCFAWTTAVLAVAGYISVLLQADWLKKEPETMALWLLPLASFSILALRFESLGRIRWTLPFHIVALVVLVAGLDVMAGYGPTLGMLGLNANLTPFLNPDRQQFLSFAINGVLFLILMLLTENSRSLDLRRGSRLLEIAAILHLLGGLYANANKQRASSNVIVDVSLYLAAVLLFLIMGPWRSRWRMLVGALSGVALGSYLLIDLNLVPKTAFVLTLGTTGLVVAIVAYVYLLMAPRWKKQ
jgi:hypothetical protein